MKLTENQMYALAAVVVGGVLWMYYKKAKGTMPASESVLPTQTKPNTAAELQTAYGSAMI